jgi:hypothetical protein
MTPKGKMTPELDVALQCVASLWNELPDDDLPSDATWREVIEELLVRDAHARGIDEPRAPGEGPRVPAYPSRAVSKRGMEILDEWEAKKKEFGL